MQLRHTLVASLFLLSGFAATPASAFDWTGLGYFGGYRPYGIQSRSSVATPPYFALHPPVYYGNRHARPYGISPFASLPQVAAPSTYKGRLAADFVNPPQQNPYCESCQAESMTYHGTSASHRPMRKIGNVRSNPFAGDSNRDLADSDI